MPFPTSHVIATLFNPGSVRGGVVLGIPDEALIGGAAAIILLVVSLKFIGGKKGGISHTQAEPEAEGVAAEEHTGLEDLIDKPSSTSLPSLETVEEEEDAGMSVSTGSIESMLAKPIDAAPSIGSEEKTDVEGGLDVIKFEKGMKAEVKPAAPQVVITPEKPKGPVPSTAKNLVRLREQFGEEFNVDELGEIVAVPEELAKYTPPKDIGAKAEVEAEKPRPVKLYDRPSEKRKENYKRYCMLEFDAGKPAKKVENLLRVKGMKHTDAKQLVFKMYRLWLEKREPIIRDIKETRGMAKRIEYKYLKRQIDESTRKKTLNNANAKLAGLEAKLKSSEDYFA